MRAHHVITVVIVLVTAFGAKEVLFPPMKADADISGVPSARLNVLQIQRDMDTNSLPVLKMNDKTFVFTDKE